MSVNFDNPEYLDLKARIRENPKDFVAVIGAGLSVPAGLPDRQKLRQLILDDAFERILSLVTEDQEEPLKELELVSGISDNWRVFSRLKEILGKELYESSIKKFLTTRGKFVIPKSYLSYYQT
jgi:NAD-dependent SIR2 family protein deacetylase